MTITVCPASSSWRRRHLLGDDGHSGKERDGFFGGHVEDIGDGLAAEGDFQSLGAEAGTICKRRK